MKKLLPKIKNDGFTLIELLVVVMVIAALSGIVVSLVNSGGFRDKAKDAQRVADLKQIQTALELYFADYRQYPDAGWVQITGNDAASSALAPNYINKIPVDPDNSGNDSSPCSNADNNRYNYTQVDTRAGYVLTAMMDLADSNDGNECNLLNNWSNYSLCSIAGDVADKCYGVENP